MKKQDVIKFVEEKFRELNCGILNRMMDMLQIIVERISDNSRKLKEIKEDNTVVEDCMRMNMILAGIVADKYENGCVIVYDEKNPRYIFVAKDGKITKSKDISSVSFSWYRGEFPTLNIES